MDKKFLELPKDVMVYTLSFLDLPSLFKFSLICKKGSVLFREESLWRLLFLRDLGDGEGEEIWMQKYKNSLFKWEHPPNKLYSLSKDRRRATKREPNLFLLKSESPLQKNVIHKCLPTSIVSSTKIH